MSHIHKCLVVSTNWGVQYSGDTCYLWSLGSVREDSAKWHQALWEHRKGKLKDGEPGCHILHLWALPEIHPGKEPGCGFQAFGHYS